MAPKPPGTSTSSGSKNASGSLHGDTGIVIGVNSERTVKFTWVAVKKAQRWRVVSETFSRVPVPK